MQFDRFDRGGEPADDSERERQRCAFERRALLGLSAEWEEAVAGRAKAPALKKPMFRLADFKSRWGQWDRLRREIVLSRELVFAHSWDAVREVLYHEIAHQLADHLFPGGNGTPHGPAFRDACARLGANPAAAGRFPLLDARIADDAALPADRILCRVRKLMALSGSPNAHEAESAMKKAHALIARHNVEAIENRDARRFESCFLGSPALRHPRDAYYLANLLIDFYFIEGVWVPAWALEKERMGRVLEISGTRQNIRLAGYVHDYVNRYIARQWAQYRKTRGLPQHRRTDYAVGIVTGFRTTLERSVPEIMTAAERRALIRKKDSELGTYLKTRYPSVVSRRAAARSPDPRVMEDGIREGKKLVIAKGIDQHAPTQRQPPALPRTT